MKNKSFRKNNKKYMQHGGITIDINESLGINSKEDAFRVFLMNSTFELLSTSSLNGIIIKATLFGDIYSPYISIRSDSFGKRINSLIIKLVFVDGPETLSVPKIRQKPFPNTTSTEFSNEVGVQIDIFRESCLDGNALDAICPAIVNFFATPAGHPFLKKFLNVIFNRISYENENATELLYCIKAIYDVFKNEDNSSMKLGVIAMELADEYKPLNMFSPSVEKTHPEYNNQKNLYFVYQSYALFELKRLHKLGYVHGDFHQDNILINPDTEYFTKHDGSPSVIGRAMIIDFDRTRGMDSSRVEFPEGLSIYELDNWSTINSIEMELMNTSRKIPPAFIEQGRKLPEGYVFSKVFPDRATYISYAWMELYSPTGWLNREIELKTPQPQPKLFTTLMDNIDNNFPMYRKAMVDAFNKDVLDLFPDLFDPTSDSSLKILLYPNGGIGPPVHKEGPEFSIVPNPFSDGEYRLFGGKVDIFDSRFAPLQNARSKKHITPVDKKNLSYENRPKILSKTMRDSSHVSAFSKSTKKSQKPRFPIGLTREVFIKMIRDTITPEELDINDSKLNAAFAKEPITINKLRRTAKSLSIRKRTRKTRKYRKSA